MIIDADAHIEESESMFERLDKEFRPRRPLPVRLDRDTVYGRYNAVWLIDGETYPKLVGKGGTIFRTPTLMEAATQKRESIGAQEIIDVPARIRDMNKVKIDTQVVFPSLFLTHTAEDLKLEAALLRAYNSFLGECATASKGRIRFAALVPIRDVAESIKEVKRAARPAPQDRRPVRTRAIRRGSSTYGLGLMLAPLRWCRSGAPPPPS
jgi:hypothetical protein